VFELDEEGRAIRQQVIRAHLPHNIEDEPQDREGQPCWCTDYHREAAIFLDYCPRHGRKPERELWDESVESYPGVTPCGS
jgi:hypothetical protein